MLSKETLAELRKIKDKHEQQSREIVERAYEIREKYQELTKPITLYFDGSGTIPVNRAIFN